MRIGQETREWRIFMKINNKMYIGQTITTIKERMYKHYSNAKKATTGIDFAFGKYGKENFIVEEVCSCLDEDLDDLEQFYIAKFDTYNSGYNLTIGGQGTSRKVFTDEERKAISERLKGHAVSEETRIKMRENMLAQFNDDYFLQRYTKN